MKLLTQSPDGAPHNGMAVGVADSYNLNRFYWLEPEKSVRKSDKEG
jgi:hypothetical protein